MKEQIKEMAQLMCEDCASSGAPCTTDLCDAVVQQAQVLYNAGYRKQIEGEWKWISDDDVICSACGKVFYTADNADAGLSIWSFCPNCGAKMKGGAE